jgi:hypothetical protein
MKKSTKIFLMGILVCITGCTINLPRDVPIESAHHYKFSLDQEGLIVSVDPFLEKERLETFFGCDLLSRGIMPVIVLAKNHHPSFTYLLQSQDFSAAKKGEPDANQTNKDLTLPPPKERESVPALRVAGLFFPIVLFPLMAISAQEQDIRIINENLKRKALTDRTLFPGESHFGFVYFKVADREDAQQIAEIIVRAKNIQSEKEIIYVFRISK